MSRAVPGPCYGGVVWLTRDSYEGVPETHVDVWTAPPVRRDDYAGDFIEWLDESDEGIAFHLDALTVAEAKLRFRTVPDTDRECVRIGRAS